MTFHTILHKSEQYIEALRRGRQLTDALSETINKGITDPDKQVSQSLFLLQNRECNVILIIHRYNVLHRRFQFCWCAVQFFEQLTQQYLDLFHILFDVVDIFPVLVDSNHVLLKELLEGVRPILNLPFFIRGLISFGT